MTGAALMFDFAELGIDIGALHPEAKSVDGMEDALVGTACSYGDEPVLVYSVDRIILILVNRQGMEYEDARDWFCNNIWCAFGQNPGDPIFIDEIDPP
jgi:hypothetical protein